ncbi:Hypothetical protein ABZS17G119_03031 [Kosakonia cowanii]
MMKPARGNSLSPEKKGLRQAELGERRASHSAPIRYCK